MYEGIKKKIIDSLGVGIGFGYKIEIFPAGVDPRRDGARPRFSQIIKNHMTYEGMDYICNTAFAAGSFYQSAYVGLVNGFYAAPVSNFTDTAFQITTSTPGAGGVGVTNAWSEITTASSGSTVTNTTRQLVFTATNSPLTYGTISGAQFQLTGIPPAASFVGGSGGGTIWGVFLVVGTSTFGVASTRSFYNGGSTTPPSGPCLISVALAGSTTPYTNGETIQVTPISLTLTSA